MHVWCCVPELRAVVLRFMEWKSILVCSSYPLNHGLPFPFAQGSNGAMEKCFHSDISLPQEKLEEISNSSMKV